MEEKKERKMKNKVILVIVILIIGFLLFIFYSTENKVYFSNGIHTSNGIHFDEVNGENIQVALDSFGGQWTNYKGGTVWVGEDFSLTESLEMRSYVTLDLLENTVTMDGNVPFVNFSHYTNELNGEEYGCYHAEVKNAIVVVNNDVDSVIYDEDVISFYIPPEPWTYEWRKSLKFNRVENIDIVNEGTWISGQGRLEHDYTGIHLNHNGGNGSSMFWNIFEDVTMEYLDTGIKLTMIDSDGYGGWANGNKFQDIWISNYRVAVGFYVAEDVYWGYNRNLFYNVRSQTSQYMPPTEYGVENIQGRGNAFVDCLMWDWHLAQNAGTGVYQWWVGQDATDTVLNINGVSTTDFLDEGTRTIIREGCYEYKFSEPSDLDKIFGFTPLEIILISILILLVAVIFLWKKR